LVLSQKPGFRFHLAIRKVLNLKPLRRFGLRAHPRKTQNQSLVLSFADLQNLAKPKTRIGWFLVLRTTKTWRNLKPIFFGRGAHTAGISQMQKHQAANCSPYNLQLGFLIQNRFSALKPVPNQFLR